MVQNKFPNVDDAWAWFLGFVPEGLRPTVALIAVILVLIWLIARFANAIIDLFSKVKRFSRRAQKDDQSSLVIPSLPAARQKIWDEPVDNPPRPIDTNKGGIPIISIATMKGGVGKTTMVANLAAHLDQIGKRVLLIDFDYQGSLSTMVTSFTGESVRATKSDDLISGETPITEILQSAISLGPKLSKTSIITSYYEFSDTETNVMLDWLRPSNSERGEDVRFRLTALLSTPEVQKSYDYILIDTPPRFTTSTINALCASTHLIIPSILDQMSAEAAVYFSRDIAAMRSKLFPNLQFLGLIPTFTYRADTLTIREQGIVDYLEAALKPYWGHMDWVHEEASIPRKNSIGDIAGRGIAYVDAGTRSKTNEVRAIFSRLYKRVLERLDKK